MPNNIPEERKRQLAEKRQERYKALLVLQTRILDKYHLDDNDIPVLEEIAMFQAYDVGNIVNVGVERFKTRLYMLFRKRTEVRNRYDEQIKKKEREVETCEGKIQGYETLIAKATKDQEDLIAKKTQEIQDKCDAEIKRINEECDVSVKQIRKGIEQKNNELIALNNKKIDTIKNNSKITVNFRLFIEILLAVLLLGYLWIFYSTATFSAFFKDADSLSSNVVNIFLDPTAISEAWSKGFGVGLFITLFPFIFVTLGYMTFSKENSEDEYIKEYKNPKDNNIINQGKKVAGKIGKKLQILFILCIAFAYDVLIAYIIANNVYKQTIELGRDQVFNWEICIRDPHFWLIIGAGFIVYIIFGWLCNMASERWAQLNPKETEMRKLDAQINAVESYIHDQQDKIDGRNGQLQDDILKENTKCVAAIKELPNSPDVKNISGKITRYNTEKNATINRKQELTGEIETLKNINNIPREDAEIYASCLHGWSRPYRNSNNYLEALTTAYNEFRREHGDI